MSFVPSHRLTTQGARLMLAAALARAEELARTRAIARPVEELRDRLGAVLGLEPADRSSTPSSQSEKNDSVSEIVLLRTPGALELEIGRAHV